MTAAGRRTPRCRVTLRVGCTPRGVDRRRLRDAERGTVGAARASAGTCSRCTPHQARSPRSFLVLHRRRRMASSLPRSSIGGMLGGDASGTIDVAARSARATTTRIGSVRARRHGRHVRRASSRPPITSVLIIIEMTGGYGLILPLMIANMTAYGLARRWRPIVRRAGRAARADPRPCSLNALYTLSAVAEPQREVHHADALAWLRPALAHHRGERWSRPCRTFQGHACAPSAALRTPAGARGSRTRPCSPWSTLPTTRSPSSFKATSATEACGSTKGTSSCAPPIARRGRRLVPQDRLSSSAGYADARARQLLAPHRGPRALACAPGLRHATPDVLPAAGSAEQEVHGRARLRRRLPLHPHRDRDAHRGRSVLRRRHRARGRQHALGLDAIGVDLSLRQCRTAVRCASSSHERHRAEAERDAEPSDLRPRCRRPRTTWLLRTPATASDDHARAAARHPGPAHRHRHRTHGAPGPVELTCCSVGLDFAVDPVVREFRALMQQLRALSGPSSTTRRVATLAQGERIHLIVVDGTWWQAEAAHASTPQLAALPRLAFLHPRARATFTASAGSLWPEFCVSTIEALAETLSVLTSPSRATSRDDFEVFARALPRDGRRPACTS